MVDVALLVAVALLIVGVVGSIVPLAPGPPVSVAAVLGYWAYSGFSEPGAFTVVGLVLVGVVAFSADQDVRRGLRTAAATTIGILGGTAVQALLTFGMLIGFVLAVT